VEKYVLLVLLVFVFLRLEADSDLVIKDPQDYLHYRISLNTKELFKEQKDGIWVSQGKLSFSNIDLRDFKILTNQSFDVGGKILVSIEGTGQLFELDIKIRVSRVYLVPIFGDIIFRRSNLSGRIPCLVWEGRASGILITSRLFSPINYMNGNYYIRLFKKVHSKFLNNLGDMIEKGMWFQSLNLLHFITNRLRISITGTLKKILIQMSGNF
jgi:hypothetical protein